MRRLYSPICASCRQRFYSSSNQLEHISKPIPDGISVSEAKGQGKVNPIKLDDLAPQKNPETTQLGTSGTTLSSTERLSQDFRRRIKTRRLHDTRDLVTRTSHAPSVVKLRGRMPVESNTLLSRKVSPLELLQKPETDESVEAINAAIEGCLRAALQRLDDPELHDSQSLHETIRRVPHDQYLWLCSILKFQFTKAQLVNYGTACGLIKSHLIRLKTDEVIHTILKIIWKLEKEDELPSDETMVTKCCHLKTLN